MRYEGQKSGKGRAVRQPVTLKACRNLRLCEANQLILHLRARTSAPLTVQHLVDAGFSLKTIGDYVVRIRRGPSSIWYSVVACLGTGASAGVCTGAKDGADGAGSCFDRPRTAAAVQP